MWITFPLRQESRRSTLTTIRCRGFFPWGWSECCSQSWLRRFRWHGGWSTWEKVFYLKRAALESSEKISNCWYTANPLSTSKNSSGKASSTVRLRKASLWGWRIFSQRLEWWLMVQVPKWRDLWGKRLPSWVTGLSRPVSEEQATYAAKLFSSRGIVGPGWASHSSILWLNCYIPFGVEEIFPKAGVEAAGAVGGGGWDVTVAGPVGKKTSIFWN